MSVNNWSDAGRFYQSWETDSTPKASVILIHGLGEHCQRYEALGQYLNKHDINLHSMDLPSHGQSDGRRGHVDNFSVFQDAALGLFERVQQAHPEPPIFLLGHSMGGLIAAHLLIDHQEKFQGAMLSGAAIQSPQEPPAWQVMIIKSIAKIAPKLGMLSLDASGVSRDSAVVDKYMADPLVSKDKLSARFLVELTNTMEETKLGAKQISLPILIMHGSADVMTAPQGSQLLHDSVSSEDKQLKMYEGLYHEIFNEPEAPEIYSELVEWITQRI